MRAPRLLPVALVALFAASSARGMVFQRCAEASLFRDARVNVAVLPYEFGVQNERSDAGDALSLLVQMNTLRSILKFESVGAVTIVRPPGESDRECTEQRTWQRLNAQLTAGNGLLMVWGRIFEDGGTIYEQTFARFARGGGDEGVSLKVGENTFRGTLSTTAVAFPPQLISRADLELIGQLSEKFARLRPEPRDDVEGTSVLHGLEKCLGCAEPARASGFVITEVRGNWAKLEGRGDGGWIKLDTGFGEMSLADKMPELHFFEGIAGYLATRAMRAHDAAPPAAMLAAADQALREYINRTREASPAIAATVAQELRATLIGDSEKEVAALSAAVSADPADAHAKNLLAIAKLRRWVVTSKSTSQPEIAEHFVAAAVLDPDHRDSLVNLRSFYQLVLSGKGPAVANADKLPAKEAKSRLAMVEKMLAAGATSPDR